MASIKHANQTSPALEFPTSECHVEWPPGLSFEGNPSHNQHGVEARPETSRLLVCLAIHALLDLLLVIQPFGFFDPLDCIALAVPFAQNGMLLIWSAASTRRLWQRFGVVILSCAGTWYVVSTSVAWTAGAESFHWATVIVTQAATIWLLIGAWRIEQWMCRRLRSAAARKFRFELSGLCLLTAELAIVFGLIRVAQQQNLISPDLRLSPWCALLGACCASYAMVACAAARLAVGVGWKILATLAAVSAFGLVPPLASLFVLDVAEPISWWPSFVTANAQAVVIVTTLGILGIVGSDKPRPQPQCC